MERHLVTLVVMLAGWVGFSGQAATASATITISCGAVGAELALCRAGAERWAAETGHRVEVVSTPNSSTERLALYQQLLAARADDIDVFQIDVIWPGLLANHLIDLNPLIGDSAGLHYPAMLKNNTVDDRLVAMPWFASVGVLYYRSDLLEKHGAAVPDSWDTLGETAATVQAAERAGGNQDMWGYVWQGRAYEGLTCNALEWVASAGGGTVVGSDGSVTINNPQAIAAVARAARWVNSISPPGILNYAEEEARGVFQSGNAVFMRNWPYAWALSQGPDSPVRDKVGVAPLPRGPAGESVSALGGWQLAVSRYSKNPEVAADLVRFLTSPEEQKHRAIEASLNPTIPRLYEDAEVLAAAPFFADLVEIMRNAVPRPSAVTGSRYNQVSSAFWSATHEVLGGRRSADESLATLSQRLNRLSRGGKRW